MSKGWHNGESTRLPPMWPGFKSQHRRHMWVEFVVGSLLCSEGFFFHCALRFSLLLKNQHCQITIRPRIWYTRNHFMDVLPLNQYVFLKYNIHSIFLKWNISCVMSSEYFTRTSLYLVRLKIFEWVKFHRRHLHQIQGNWAGRNFVTALRVTSRLITHARMQRWIWKLQLPTDSTFE